MSDKPTPKEKRSVEIHYEKAPDYSTRYADGVIVAPNARGMISVTFYNQRFTIPKKAQLVEDEDGDEVEKFVDGKKGLFRQIENTTFIDTGTARELIEWLQRAVAFLEESSENDDELDGSEND